jgi:hypothetical protein
MFDDALLIADLVRFLLATRNAFEVFGAAFDGGDRRLDIAVTGDHHDWAVRDAQSLNAAAPARWAAHQVDLKPFFFDSLRRLFHHF